MEQYIKNNVSDVTYLSELILPFLNLLAINFRKGGINSPKQLTSLVFRKLWAH